jgi:hypothetical protein
MSKNNNLRKLAQTHIREAAQALAQLHVGVRDASESRPLFVNRQELIDAGETFLEHANVLRQSLAAITEAYPGWLPEVIPSGQQETVPAGAD